MSLAEKVGITSFDGAGRGRVEDVFEGLEEDGWEGEEEEGEEEEAGPGWLGVVGVGSDEDMFRICEKKKRCGNVL
jgi:hypothetical protein